MRKQILLSILIFSITVVAIGAEKYSYIGYVAYPKSELRGYAVEQLSNGGFKLEKFNHPISIQGAIPVGTYVGTNPLTPDRGSLFILGLDQSDNRQLYNCGQFDLKSVAQIECIKQTNSGPLGGTANFSGGSTTGLVTILNVNSRRGTSNLSQGYRFDLNNNFIKSRFAFFLPPFRYLPANTIVSQSVGWDLSMAAESTPSQLILRKLSPQNGAGLGSNAVYNYNPTSRIVSLSLSAHYSNLGNHVDGNGLMYREQRNVGAPNAQSSVWLSYINNQVKFDGPPQMVVGWKKTGNTNGELFASVVTHAELNYFISTDWLPGCNKLGYGMRTRNSDGTYRFRRKLEDCASLMGSSVGSIGGSISPTYEDD